MPQKKESLITKIKLWLYYRLSSWYLNKYIWDEDAKNWVQGNVRFRETLSLKIYQDFGSRCKEFNFSCSVCQAHHALDIFKDLYWDDSEKPTLYNLHEEKK